MFEPVVAAEPVALPPEAGVVELPRAEVRTPLAGDRATKLIMGITFFMLLALAVLCAVGPHIPAGE